MLCTLGLAGQPFRGLAFPVGTNSHAGGQQLWEEPNAGKICPGELAALLGKLIWHDLVVLGSLVDPGVVAALRWFLNSREGLPLVWFWPWLWVIWNVPS